MEKQKLQAYSAPKLFITTLLCFGFFKYMLFSFSNFFSQEDLITASFFVTTFNLDIFPYIGPPKQNIASFIWQEPVSKAFPLTPFLHFMVSSRKTHLQVISRQNCGVNFQPVSTCVQSFLILLEMGIWPQEKHHHFAFSCIHILHFCIFLFVL